MGGTKIPTGSHSADHDRLRALTRLDALMALGSGGPEVPIGLLDGPVADDHPGLSGAAIQVLGDQNRPAGGAALRHGTAVAGILVAGRDSGAIGTCPRCPLISRPIFQPSNDNDPAGALAEGIVECVSAGARLINVSGAYVGPLRLADHRLRLAIDHAAARGVLIVAAAGNDGRVLGSPLLSHPWVVPVSACDLSGNPVPGSNLGASIGRNGLRAPGVGVTSLTPGPGLAPFAGTSAATPLVTGAIALAWALAPATSAARVRAAVRSAGAPARRSVVPPLLDAWRIHQHINDQGGSV